MTKRWLCVSLVALVLAVLFCGCSSDDTHNVISCTDVIAAYEEAGYTVWHNEHTEGDFLCHVNVDSPDGDTIYFTFFASADEAQLYEKDVQWNFLLWAYSLVNGDPIWVHTETYDTFVIQYENADTYAPFRDLK